MLKVKNLFNNDVVLSFGKKIDFVPGVSTDSRNFNSGHMFVALCGDKFDGAEYGLEVIKKGAGAIALTNNEKNLTRAKEINGLFPDVLILLVSDTLKYLQTLSRDHIHDWRRAKPSRRVVGITGSNGKTTHKEMLYFLLSSVFPNKVLATKGNLNNHIGVPLTLLTVAEAHDIAIVEIGTNHPGEIDALCSIAKPDSGLITNIGYAHIEFLGSLEGVFKEKRSLYDWIFKNVYSSPLFVANADDPYLSKLEDVEGVFFLGEKRKINPKILKNEVSFSLYNKEWRFCLKDIFGEHNLKNMATCLVLAMALYPNHSDDFIKVVPQFVSPKNNRAMWVDYADKKVLMDAYNANPSSMQVSLLAFIQWCHDNKISLNAACFILGDMNELGESGLLLHREIGVLLKKHNAVNVLAVGHFAKHYMEGFGDKLICYSSREDLEKDWKELVRRYKVFFVKGSRTLQLERLVSITI